MALVSSTIPNLINGVSQQPAALRLASQAEAVINCMPSPVEGLKKRPASNYIKQLFAGSAGSGRPFFTIVDRDGSNRWGILLQDNAIKVFDLDGTLKTVATPNGTSYLDVAGEPSQKFRVASIADYTFIVNREKTVAMKTDAGDKSPTYGTKSMVFVKAAEYNTTYTVNVAGTAVSYTTPAVGSGQPTTPTIATSLGNNLAVSALNPVATTLTTNAAGTTTTANFASTTGVVVGQYIRDANGRIPLQARVTNVTSTQVTFSPAASANVLASDTVTFRTDNYIISSTDYIIEIEKQDGTDYTLKATDGYDGESIIAIKGTVSDVTKLPTIARHGFIVEVQGNTSTEFDDWYLIFETTAGSGFGPGVWKETVAPGIDYKLDPATMPHVLVKEANGTFTFKQFDWGNRLAGNTTSAPNPSFIGGTINNITIFRNRLGLLTDENVVLSAADAYEQFFPETVQSTLDSDPIDLAAGGNQVNILLSAVPFASTLLLFSKHGQFRLDSGTSLTTQPLTPRSATITAMTAFELYDGADPVTAGRTIFFPVPRGEYSGLREYFLPDTTSPVPASDEVTAAVPRYIPNSIVQLAASVSEEMVAVLTKDEAKRIYIYKFFFQGDQKLQSSWSYWEMQGSKTVLGLQFLDSDLYAVVEYADGVYLEKLYCRPEHVDTGSDYELLVDRKAIETSCTVALTNPAGLDVQSTITLPYPRNTGAQMVVVGRQVNGNSIQPGQVIFPISQGSNTLTVRGNLTSAKFFVGELYPMRYEFSTPYLKEQPQGGGIAVIGGPRMQMRTWTVIHDKAGHFELWITPRGRTTRKHPFDGLVMGDGGTGLGEVARQVGKLRVPVLAQNIDTKVEIYSNSPLPCRIQSAEWEGYYFSRTQRL